MDNGKIVVSLFDGMSCGQIALNKAGIKIAKYFAAEIKPHAIKVTQHNYPDTIQIGDVTKVSFKNGILYTENGEFNVGHIDIVIGGSPCQDFSRGNATRDGLAGLKSGLFYHYLRILKECNPKNYLLENVIMSDSDYALISGYMGTEPVRINSSRVSAQLRDRLYWTNIGGGYYDLFGGCKSDMPQPEDKKINLVDILENGWTDREKSRTLLESDSRPLRNQLKMFHRYYSKGFTTLVFRDESVYKEMIALYEQAMPGKVNQINPSLESNGVQPYMQNRIFADTGKAPCLTQFADRMIVFQKEGNIRYLTQLELERLQTVPEGYTSILKRNDAACLLGDGWTVDAIAHIFKYLN